MTPLPGSSWLFLNVFGSETDEGIEIFNITGLGPPKATVAGSGGPNYDGIRATSIRTDSRHLLVTLAIRPGEDEEVTKQKIYDTFRIKQEMQIRFTTDSKTVDINGYVESVEMNQFAKVENAVISILCTDPYYRKFTQENTTILYTGTLIDYDAEVERGCEITFTVNGSGVSPPFWIENDSGSRIEEMNFNIPSTIQGYPPISGDTVVLNTNRGLKSIIFTNGWGSFNLINYLDLADPWIQLYLGNVNDFQWSVAAGQANISAKVKFYKLYEGV